ncbi:response regulator transcription factor [Aequorivita antarctica]|uniref:Response regulator n=1 Tax=Aequorivita antarctica TaxID=153266 RepID=A0A5C6YZ32_9FLAO|nr:response regulator [Aequorivita antarctica]TXD72921.1 response regulator [Aequorivita antarctica]SRX74672.1 Response regulator MprA [Aequorivita antarctica]
MKKILIVDDDRMIGEMLKYMFNFSGYEVFVTIQAGDAYHTILKHKIDLIILDKFLAGLDGMALCNTFTTNKHTAHVPIIMMSALPEIRTECLRAGASAFIAKPFEMNTLLEKIEMLLCKKN